MDQSFSRRSFAKAAAATALSYSRIIGANERVRMGYIGLGNRGDQVHDAFLETGGNETAAVCDLRDYDRPQTRKSAQRADIDQAVICVAGISTLFCLPRSTIPFIPFTC